MNNNISKAILKATNNNKHALKELFEKLEKQGFKDYEIIRLILKTL